MGRLTDWEMGDLRPDSQQMLRYGSLWANVPDYEGEQRIQQLEFMNGMVDFLSRDLGVEFDEFMAVLWESIALVRENEELYNLG